MNTVTLGRIARAARRRQRLRQDELAALAGVGNRFVSELEHGKAGLELGRTLRVLATLGLALHLTPRSWEDIERDADQ
ncbi:MAG: transcriptional regulator [Gammaproteobacteria bacterium]